MEKTDKIYIAGHRGLVGSAVTRALQKQGYINFVERTHAELELTDQRAVADFFAIEKPDYVVLAAARVGGIVSNSTYPAEFVYSNLGIQTNVIHHAWKSEGYGDDLTIRQLAEAIVDVAGFKGTIEWDRSKPDGTPRTLMDSSRMRALGWQPRMQMKDGLRTVAALVEQNAAKGA